MATAASRTDAQGPRAPDPRDGIRTRIGDALDARGWQQQDLADALGISKAAVSKWLGAGPLASWLRLAEVCGVLGCSADELLGLGHPLSRMSLDQAITKLREALILLETGAEVGPRQSATEAVVPPSTVNEDDVAPYGGSGAERGGRWERR